MLKCLMIFFTLSFLSGCSLQAHRPAPVQNLNFAVSANFDKGSITSNRYKVNKGDTLYSIAWGADKDVQELAKLNRLDDSYIIYPGQILVLSKTHTKKTIKKEKVNTYVGNSSKNKRVNKKTVAIKKQQAYVVKKELQNNKIHKIKPNHIIPTKVARWGWPVKGRVIETFTTAEPSNNGIKIAGKRGEKIKAAASGRVVYAGSGLRGYGNLIIIKHSNDFLSAYAHTDNILVKEKQPIKIGQTIATMGSTDTNRVMLHFEIRYHGKSVNPLKYLPKR